MADGVAGLTARKFRVARPTDRLPALERFYVVGLGLQRLGGFTDHDGYSGLILGGGLADLEIEFTTHEEGSPCPAPSADNLLVFYLEDAAAVDAVRQRMEAIGVVPVAPENPYWEGISLTFQDADGWRVTVVTGGAPGGGAVAKSGKASAGSGRIRPRG